MWAVAPAGLPTSDNLRRWRSLLLGVTNCVGFGVRLWFGLNRKIEGMLAFSAERTCCLQDAMVLAQLWIMTSLV